MATNNHSDHRGIVTNDRDRASSGGQGSGGRGSGRGGSGRVGSGIDTAPLAVLAAGVVVGAVAGALLPRTDRETELLGPVGSQIGQAAAEVARAAREAGKQELGLLGDSRSPMEAIVDKAMDAVAAVSSAAGNAAALKVTGKQDG